MDEKDESLLTLEFMLDSDDWPVTYVLLETDVMLSRETLSAFFYEFAEGIESGEVGLVRQGPDSGEEIH